MSWWEQRKVQYIPEGLRRNINDVLLDIDDHKMYSAVKRLLEIEKVLSYLEHKLKEDYETKEADG